MNEFLTDRMTETETMVDQLDAIMVELDLAQRWEKPSVLFAIYDTDATHNAAKNELEKMLNAGNQETSHFQINFDAELDQNLFASEFAGDKHTVYFIDPGITEVDSQGKIEQLVSMLNSCGEYLMENNLRVVFWLTEDDALAVAHHSSDFWASRHRVFEFFHRQDETITTPAVKTPASTLVISQHAAVQVPNSLPATMNVQDYAGEAAMVIDLSEADEAASDGMNTLVMLGVENLKDSHHQQASQSLQKALTLAEDSGNTAQQAMFHQAIALVNTEAGNVEEAIGSYQSAIKLGHENAAIWNNLGSLYLGSGKVTDAQNAFGYALKNDATNPVSWNGLGNIHTLNGKHEEAVGCFRKAIQLNASYVTPWYQLGGVLLKQNRKEDALFALMRTVEMDNKNVHAWAEIGNIYFKAGSFEQAIDAFKKALQLGVATVELFSSLAEAFSMIGNYPDAIDNFQKAIERATNNKEKAVLWNKLGDVHRRINDYEEAVTAYEMADTLCPSEENTANKQMAEFQMVTKTTVQTAEPVKVKSANRPTVGSNTVVSIDNITPAGFTPIRTANIVEAPQYSKSDVFTTDYSSSANITGTIPLTGNQQVRVDLSSGEPKNAKLWSRLGSTYLKAGAFDRAVDAYQKAVTLDPSDGKLCCDLAEIFAQKMELDKAIFYHRKAVDVFSDIIDKANSLNRVGDLYRMKKEYVSALEAFELAIMLNPESEAILAGLTRVQDDLDQIGQPAARQAVISQPVVRGKNRADAPAMTGSNPNSSGWELNPNLNNANVWNELGNIFSKSKSFDDAMGAYNKAIELNPDFGWAYCNLAQLLARQGKRTESITLFVKSIDLLWTDADKTVAWNRLGDVYRQAGKYADAIDAYQNADRLNQGSYAINANEVNLDQLFPHFVA